MTTSKVMLAAIVAGTIALSATAQAGPTLDAYNDVKEIARDVDRHVRDLVDRHAEARDRELMDRAERMQREKTERLIQERKGN